MAMLASGIRSLPRLSLRTQPARQFRGIQTSTLRSSVVQPVVPHSDPLLRTSPLLPALRPKPILLLRPAVIALYATGTPPDGKNPRLKEMIPDLKREEELRHSKLAKSPKDEVTTTSSLREIVEPRDPGEEAPSPTKALAADVGMVRETFAMKHVPKDLITMGVLGLVPYVATSATTLFLAWDIGYSRTHGQPYFMTVESAQQILTALEPIQIGYGAVILSFLGAIHWGLEFAKYGGTHGYKRYAIGILAPMLAWPTCQLPLDIALLSQFVGFTGMYFADVIATRWGWAPAWYTNYRFALTFVVGACIVLTLIARSEIGDRRNVTGSLKSNEYIEHLRKIQGEYHHKEEQEIEERKKAEDEEEKKKEEEAAQKKAGGALKQADKSKKPNESVPEGGAKRRVHDQEESEEEKEQAHGPKKTNKTVDPSTVKGTPDKQPHDKTNDSQRQQEE